MALTGDADGPPLLVATSAAAAVDEDLAPVGLDARVLGERAALLGLRRQGSTSCGGATRLLPTRDGWIAVALPRESDVELVPALVGAAVAHGDHWSAVERWAGARAGEETEERAALLGLAASVVGGSGAEVAVRGRGRRPPDEPAPRAPRVVDLTALWAGPLCTDLLRRLGGEVVKVEATARPDGARSGVPGFHDLLNHGKRSVALDLGAPEGRRVLHGLVAAADVVVTSARARAVAQFGLDPDAFLAGGDDRVWVAITGHGWSVDRIGFGDDAAAAAGLVAWGDDGRPRFAGDAIADPLAGVLAARLADRAWRAGGRWFLDVPLAGAARLVAPVGRPVAVPAVWRDGRWWATGADEVAAPVARAPRGPAAELGADADRVARWLDR